MLHYGQTLVEGGALAASGGMWGQNLQDDPLWWLSEPRKVTGQ
jgi:hypothetical protein